MSKDLLRARILIDELKNQLATINGLKVNTVDLSPIISRVAELENNPTGGVTSYNDLNDKPTIPTLLSQLETDTNNQRVSVAEKTKTVNTINFTYFL